MERVQPLQARPILAAGGPEAYRGSGELAAFKTIAYT